MKQLLIFVTSILLFTNLFAQPKNILITNTGNPNEPSIFINSKDPSIIMAGSNVDRLFLSLDTGRTWNSSVLTSDYGVWGDPAIICDTAGDFYFLHLSNPTNGRWIDRIVSQKYITDQQIWTNDTFMGYDSRPDYAQDKEWIAVDRTNNNLYVTWTQFDKYGSALPEDSSNIFFSKSTDGGASWSQAIKINETPGDCIDSDNTTEGAVPCVGPNGEIYVSWAGPDGLVFDKSTDGGTTWLANDIFVDNFPGGWDYSIPNINRCNGLPVTDCDISGGQYNGDIYINWTDQRNGDHNTDVWLAKSSDAGSTWSAPIRVNDDTTETHQFLTWMDIDQSTGYLYFVFYDRRRFTDAMTDVTLAISKDGGQTFENYRINETAFMPNSNVFFGDYTNISVQDGIVRPVWTKFDNSSYLTMWTAIINPETNLSIFDQYEVTEHEKGIIYPNPTNEIAYFSFKLRKQSTITIKVIDAKGSVITTLVDNKIYIPGKFIQRLKVKDYNLKAGAYHFQFISEDRNYSKSFIVN